MVSQNHGILYTAFLVPSDQEDADSYRQDPNYAIMATQEDTDETASAFAHRLIGDLVPQHFLRTLCSQAPGASDAGAVVADFGHGRYTVFAFHDDPLPSIQDLPKLNVALSMSPESVNNPNTLPIVAAGQVVYHLLRSLRSPHVSIYVKTMPLLHWTHDSHMPTSISQVSRISRVYEDVDNHYSVVVDQPSPLEPPPAQQHEPKMVAAAVPPKATSVGGAKSVATKKPPPFQRAKATKVSREALQLGKETNFNKVESAILEQAFLEHFEFDGLTEPVAKKAKMDAIDIVGAKKPAFETKTTDKKKNPVTKGKEAKAPAATKQVTETKVASGDQKKMEPKPKESAKKKVSIATETNTTMNPEKGVGTKKGDDSVRPNGTEKAMTPKERKVPENAETRSSGKTPPENR